MELWDAYDAQGSRTGRTLVRGEPIPDGCYHIVCEALVRHVDGDYLLMRRHPAKKAYPGYLEATAGGSALRGEDALACMCRELREETGITNATLTLVAHSRDDEENALFFSYLALSGTQSCWLRPLLQCRAGAPARALRCREWCNRERQRQC